MRVYAYRHEHTAAIAAVFTAIFLLYFDLSSYLVDVDKMKTTGLDGVEMGNRAKAEINEVGAKRRISLKLLLLLLAPPPVLEILDVLDNIHCNISTGQPTNIAKVIRYIELLLYPLVVTRIPAQTCSGVLPLAPCALRSPALFRGLLCLCIFLLQ